MTYRLCKNVILKEKANGTLDIQDMSQKLDVFLLNSRITEAQYNELMALMTA